VTVYVDSLRHWEPRDAHTRRNGSSWAHLFADSVEELHDFARRIGLKREWFQGTRIPHYDVAPGKWQQAVRCGAELVDTKAYLRRLSAAAPPRGRD
jgi:hypothetical protein